MMTFIKMRKGVNFRHSHFHSFPQFRGRPLAPPFPFSELLSNMGDGQTFRIESFCENKKRGTKRSSFPEPSDTPFTNNNDYLLML